MPYYIKDHLGNTRAVTDQNNAILATFDYYPFGLLMPGRYTTNNNTTEKFTGKELDSRLNLYYFGARYYDAAIGRRLSVDPLLQKHPEWSPYNYVLDNPFYFIDPDGKQIGFTAFDMGLRLGFKRSVLSSLQGAKNLVTDPVGMARGMANAVIHYKQTYAALKAGISKRYNMLSSGNPYQAGQVAGEGVALAGGILATRGAGMLAKSGVRLMKNVAKVSKSTKLLQAFNSVESLIQKAGKLEPSKHGKIGNVTGNAKNIFGGLAKQYGAKIQYTTKGVPFFKSNDISVHLYQSSSTKLPTIRIDKAGEIFKIRIDEL